MVGIKISIPKSAITFRITLSIIIVWLLTACLSNARANKDPHSEAEWKQQYYSSQRTLPDKPSFGQLNDIVDPLVQWPHWYGVQQTGKIVTRFNCFGLIGGQYTYPPVIEQWPSGSFVTPPGSNNRYLWNGMIWIGGIVDNDTLVSSSLNIPTWLPELTPPGYGEEGEEGTVTRINSPADYAMRAEFTDLVKIGGPYDRFHTPLNISIANRSYVWRQSPYDETIIYDLVITNIGDKHIESGYLGLYFDTDIHDISLQNGWEDDISGSIRSEGIGYSIDNDGDLWQDGFDVDSSVSKAFACKFLKTSFAATDTSFNWWLMWFSSIGDFGPRMKGTPEDPFYEFSDSNLGHPAIDPDKYYLLSHREWDYDQIRTATIAPDDSLWLQPPSGLGGVSSGTDTRFMMSIGPFDLLPDSSVRVLFATFTGDSVITVDNNISNLPDYPDTYLSNLNFDDVLKNAAISDTLANIITDPLNPVVGLSISYSDYDSIVITWDPHVFSDIDGYDIYLTEVSPDLLPYPGTIPPWLRPTPLVQVAQIGHESRFVLEGLSQTVLSYFNVAGRVGQLVGDPGVGLLLQNVRRGSAPVVQSSYVVIDDTGGTTIEWETPDNVDIDHYNIYRIPLADQPQPRYHPFYDLGWAADTISPVDSFFVNDTTYYYHAMNVYAQVDSSQTNYTDPTPSSEALYFVSATDKDGTETQFSDDVRSLEIVPRERDLLVITNSGRWVTYDSIKTFYRWTAAGLDYDLFSWVDSIPAGGCQSPTCFDWHNFMPYRLVIIDESLPSDFLASTVRPTLVEGLKRYVHSGGKLACFGTVTGLLQTDYTPPATDPITDNFLKTYFGVDSVSHIGLGYYNPQLDPALVDSLVDSLYGFVKAVPIQAGWPSIAYDSLRYAFSETFNLLWPRNTAPVVSFFSPGGSSEVSYLFQSKYPESSLAEGKPVGLVNPIDSTETYLFGFHLWYMDYTDARKLVNFLLDRTSTDVSNERPALPDQFMLEQNYPNPFNPKTKITFVLPHRSEVRLDIYNILGRHVRQLLNKVEPVGEHMVSWDGHDDNGQPLSSGVYLYRLKVDDRSESRKMLLLK